MKAKNRRQLVLVNSVLEERVPCALCGRTILPIMGPAVYLAANLYGSNGLRPGLTTSAVGMVCHKCTEKHAPKLNRMEQLAFDAGLYYTEPFLYSVGGKLASVKPYGGEWLSLWWWKGKKAPRLDTTPDDLVLEHFHKGHHVLAFAPKRWGLFRVEKYALSGREPGKRWKRRRFQTPTIL